MKTRALWCSALLTLCASASAQTLPDVTQLREWAGLPASYELVSKDINADNEKETGVLVRGRDYRPSKAQNAALSSYTSYTVKVFASGTLMRDRRQQILDLARQMTRLRESAKETGVGGLDDCGEFSLADGRSFYVLLGAMGPGGGCVFAVVFTDRFDLLVEQSQAEDDGDSPEHRAKPAGPVPKTSLPDLFRRVYEAVVKEAGPAK